VAVRAGRSPAEPTSAPGWGPAAAGGGVVGGPAEGAGVVVWGGVLGPGCAGDGAGDDGAGFAGGGPGFTGGEVGGAGRAGCSAPEGGRPGAPPVSGQWQPGRSTHRGGGLRSGGGAGSAPPPFPAQRPQGRSQAAGSWRGGQER
jgi:serine/threonine-protein kinase